MSQRGRRSLRRMVDELRDLAAARRRKKSLQAMLDGLRRRSAPPTKRDAPVLVPATVDARSTEARGKNPRAAGLNSDDPLGLDRLCINPRVAAAILWAEASEGAATKQNVSRTVEKFRDVPQGYLDRYLDIRSPANAPMRVSNVGHSYAVEDAFVEIESLLRRCALIELGLPLNAPTRRFAENESYVKASSRLRELQFSNQALNGFALSSCPQCYHVGETETWFGYRQVDGKRIPQSWCRMCRSRSRPRD